MCVFMCVCMFVKFTLFFKFDNIYLVNLITSLYIRYIYI